MLGHSTCLENSNNEESLFLRSLQSEEQKSNVKTVMINWEGGATGFVQKSWGDFIRSDITSV